MYHGVCMQLMVGTEQGKQGSANIAWGRGSDVQLVEAEGGAALASADGV